MLTPCPKPEPGKEARKRSQERREERRTRAQYRDSHPVCEYLDALVDKHGNVVAVKKCSELSTQVAHLRHRQMGGSRDPLVEQPENWVAACLQCHNRHHGLERGWRRIIDGDIGDSD